VATRRTAVVRFPAEPRFDFLFAKRINYFWGPLSASYILATGDDAAGAKMTT